MAIEMPKSLYNLNLHIEGKGYAGKALSFDPPTIKLNIEGNSSGLLVPRPELMGIKGILKASFELAEYSGKIQNQVGKESTTIIALGTLSDDESESSTGVQINMRGILSEYAPSKWEPVKPTKDKYTIFATYFKYSGNEGNLILDVENHKFSVDGEDIIERIRGKITV